MAPPAVQEVTTTPFPTDATAHLVNMPAVVDADDLLVTLFGNDGSATVTTPSGWTQKFSVPVNSGERLGAYFKRAVGNEDGTTVDFITSAGEKAAAQVYRIKGHHATSDPEAATSTNVLNSNPDPPNLDPAGWSTEDTLWLACFCSPPVDITGYPANYTNGVETDSNGAGAAGTKVTVGSARRNNAVAAENPGIFTPTISNWVAATIAIRPAPAGITVQVGQVTELDLAQPVTWAPKIRIIGQVAEANLSQAITARKALVVGQVSEVDLAQSIGRLKTRAVGQVTEADLAQPVSTGAKIIAVGQVIETDLAQAVGRAKAKTIGQVIETNLAQPAGRLKTKLVGQVLETDLAQAIGSLKARILGQVVEADLAQDVTPVGGGGPAPGGVIEQRSRRLRERTSRGR